MTNTTQVAADRARDDAKTVLPAEVARGLYIANPPSAQALKLMHLLIAQAGGRMADEVRHELRLSDIRKIEGMRNHDRASLRILFSELRAAILIHDDKEKRRLTIDGLLDRARIDYREESTAGDLAVSWWFSETFREIAAASTHWTIMDRQTVFALRSKYSILLFQHVASLVNLKHTNSRTFTVPELRAVFGVPDRKLKRFADLRRRVIESAIAEINQTSRLTLTATPHKTGRTVASVTIAWEQKELDQKREAKRELDRPKVGRKARRDRRAETPIVPFPASGSVRYTHPWEQLARENCNWDLKKIADAFRSFCEEKNIKLDAYSTEPIFVNFCTKQPQI